MDVSKTISEIDRELRNEDVNMGYRECISNITLEELFTTNKIEMAALTCASGFRRRGDTQKFLANLWSASYEIREEILSGQFKPKYYNKKVIMERGKVREIKPPTFKSKVVQKVICDWLIRPLLEPEMINTSYASIKGKGTDKVYKDVLMSINDVVKNKGGYIIITDFKSYFPSIDKQILKEMLSKRIRDKRIVNLIMAFTEDDNRIKKNKVDKDDEYDRGLSLGNELSQIPASFFPTEIDKTIKDSLKYGYYFRYMDDTLFVVENKREGKEIVKVLKELVEKYNLKLKKIDWIPVGNRFVFCKERYRFDKKKSKYFRLCNPKIFKTQRRKLKLFKRKVDAGKMNIEYARMQYKCVRNAIISRKNTQKALVRLEKMAKETFTGRR